MLAAFDGLQDQRSRRLLAANDFDHHVNGWIVDDQQWIGDQRRFQLHATGFRRIADEDLTDYDVPANAALECVALAEEHAGDARTDRAQAKQTDA
jgi:hypothetical protein